MRRTIPTEYQIQSTFVTLCRLHERRYPALQLAYGIPNAGAGASRGRAGKMKAEGARPGIPDWCLPVSNGRHIGLYIEFKRNKFMHGTAVQKSVHSRLRLAGHRVEVCWDVEQAWKLVREYLAGVGNSTV
jgi:hypothetical protein